MSEDVVHKDRTVIAVTYRCRQRAVKLLYCYPFPCTQKVVWRFILASPKRKYITITIIIINIAIRRIGPSSILFPIYIPSTDTRISHAFYCYHYLSNITTVRYKSPKQQAAKLAFSQTGYLLAYHLNSKIGVIFYVLQRSTIIIFYN